MMRKIEIIYDSDCPNAERARAVLREALGSLGLPANWTEWNRADAAAPAYVRRYGSPTILVDGRDVEGVEPEEDLASCRLYPQADGALSRVPSVAAITALISAPPQRLHERERGR